MINTIIKTIKDTFFLFSSKKGLMFVLPITLMQVVLAITISHEINRSLVIHSYEWESSFSSFGDSCVKGEIELSKIKGKNPDTSKCSAALEAQTTTYLSQEKSNLRTSRDHFKKRFLSYLYLNKDEIKKMERANREFSYISIKNRFDATKKAGLFFNEEREASSLKTVEFYKNNILMGDESVDQIYDEWVKILTPTLLYFWIIAFMIASLIRRKSV
ncbi:hypothetical protein KW882_04125 [Vibrio parahaemolyticus]